MLEFLFGFGVGILVGTKYNCKPYVDFILYTIKNTLQDIKSDFNSSKKYNEKTPDDILLSTLLNKELKKEI